MSIWQAVLQEALANLTHYALIALVFTQLMSRFFTARNVKRLKGTVAAFALHVIFLFVVSAMRTLDPDLVEVPRLISLVLLVMTAVGIGCHLLFALLLPRLRVRFSDLLQDLIFVGLSVGGGFAVAYRLGFNPSNLFTTSAVLTAVIGFAMQDTIGNFVAGLLLQGDGSFAVGDWVKIGDVTGRVTAIHWRYTAVETINGEQLIYPNGPLTKGQMTILGRDEGESARWCRSVQFDTDARRPPAAVIAAVTRAMEDSAIDGIVAEPPPECLLAELNGNNARYQVRFFINALEREPAIASQVRTRVHYALRRGGLPLGQSKPRNEGDLLARRMRMLSRVDLFADLPEEERTELAKSLRPVPFAPGEILTRQDEEADCLYIIHRGRVSVRVTRNGLEREAASLGKNSFFGELSVLTGERRSATVVAVTHVHCYRLKKSAFDRLLVRQPELAELMAAVLVRRLAENAAAREGLNAEARARQLAAEKNDLLLRIRAFFRIGETSERPEVAKQKLAG